MTPVHHLLLTTPAQPEPTGDFKLADHVLHVFGMWEENVAPVGNPHKNRMNMQTTVTSGKRGSEWKWLDWKV